MFVDFDSKFCYTSQLKLDFYKMKIKKKNQFNILINHFRLIKYRIRYETTTVGSFKEQSHTFSFVCYES